MKLKADTPAAGAGLAATGAAALLWKFANLLEFDVFCGVWDVPKFV